VGDDEAGTALLAAFREAGIGDSGIVRAGRSVVKVRVMAGDFSRPQQQLLRVDVEPQGPWGEATVFELIARAGVAEGAEAVVVSDYGYGAATPGLLRAVLGAAPGARVSVDSREAIGAYPDADLLTPNEWEAAHFLRRRVETDAEAAAAADELRERTGAGAVLLTRGNRGMILADGRIHALPIVGPTEIVDPSGAGDTVVAAATLARVAGASHLDAAKIANHAASVTVMRSGAATLTRDELKEALARG
jgi:rfaE bifunctional protein kinase chain/domain